MKRPRVPRTPATFALCLILLAIAVCVTLSKSPEVVARSNSVETAEEFGSTTHAFKGCQANEVLPRDTNAIRLSLISVLGPAVEVRALRGGHLLTSGERAAGWTAGDVTVPVRGVTGTFHGVRICFAFVAKDESVGFAGEPVAAHGPSRRAGGLLKIEYLEPGDRSWWSLASSVARHIAFGHAWSGIWIVALLALIVGAMLLLVARVALGLGR